MNYADQPLAEIAISIPMSTELFRKHRLDFCCGGKQTLKDACEKQSLQLNQIINELEKLDIHEKQEADQPLKDMVPFIIARYHEDLRKRIPELVTLAEKVERVHVNHKECPYGLTNLLRQFQDEMFLHMMKEENVLFPLIISGRGKLALMPIKIMTIEHDTHGKQLNELHKLTSDFVPPQDACATWRALYKGLEKLEEELMDHIHLENNILFPRALSGNE